MTTVHQLKRQARDEQLGRTPNVAGGMIAPGAVLAFVLLSIGGLAVSMSYFSYDVWAAFWIAPALMLLCVPIANHAARAENDPKVGRFILGAAFLKVIIGASARFATLEVAYGGKGDSARYHEVGAELAPQLRRLDYGDLGKISGTRFIEVLTGQLYAVTGPTHFGGYLAFSFAAFVGTYAFYRAFCLAFPDGDQRRYRLLLFLFPTVWFWPSSTGKEAWMMLCLGGAAYGLASLSAARMRGALPLGLGVWGATIVRPHVAMIFIVSAVGFGIVLLAVRRAPDIAARVPSPILTAGLCALFLVGAIAISGQVESLFGLDDLDVESADEALTETTRRTAQGGSQFDAPSPTTPLGYGKAFVTVIFRPFPMESPNLQGMITSLEGVALIVLGLLALPRLVRLPALVLSRPFIAFAAVFLLTFVFLFASIENFGILARQRTQVFPLLFVLLAVPMSSTTPPVERPLGEHPSGEPV